MVSIEHLRASNFFQDLKDEYLAKLVKICHEETYRAQDVILREGEEAKNLYILIEGIITIQIRLKKYQDIIISTIDQRGELVGWSAIVEPKCYSATVKCLETTKVFSIRSGDLEKLFEDDPVMGLTFMKKIASLIDQRLFTIRKRLINSIT